MSVIRPVTRSILSSVISSVIRTDVISRYFTLLESAAMKRFNIPQVLSGQSITMDVYPTNGNLGLPLGAPAVTDNVFQTITFTLTGNMDFIGYDGTDYFDGYIANVSVDGRLYEVKEDFATTSVLIDSLLGQNGTAVNISESDFFTQDDAGDWENVFWPNLALYSENPNPAVTTWAATNLFTTLQSSQPAPNDNSSVYKIIATSVNNVHYLRQSFSGEGTSAYTITAFAKESDTGVYLEILTNFVAGNAVGVFDLSTGTILNATNCTASCTALSDGWYIASIHIVNDISNAIIDLRPTTSGTPDSGWLGDDSKGVLVNGFQLQEGAGFTKYAKTTDQTGLKLEVP